MKRDRSSPTNIAETNEPITASPTGSKSSGAGDALENPVAQAAELGAAELGVERPDSPLDQASVDGEGTQAAAEPAAAFTREELNLFARELVDLARSMLAPKRPAWEFREQELERIGRTGGAVLDKYLPRDLGPYTVELAFGLAVVAWVTRAAREDAAGRSRATAERPVVAEPHQEAAPAAG